MVGSVAVHLEPSKKKGHKKSALHDNIVSTVLLYCTEPKIVFAMSLFMSSTQKQLNPLNAWTTYCIRAYTTP